MRCATGVLLLAALLVCPAWAGRSLNGSSQYLTTTTNVVTGPPVTVCLWAAPGTETGAQLTAYQLHYGNDRGWSIRFDSNAANDPILFLSYDGVAGSSATAPTVDFVANTWYHVCGQEAATNSRAVWVSGANKATNTDNRTGHGAATGQRIGGRGDAGQLFQGSVEQVCVWNATLVDAEVAALATGIACRRVRPANLVACPRLVSGTSPEIDECGGRTWILTGAPPLSTSSPKVVPWWPR